MDFKQLQSYVTAVKYRSFSMAAEKLGISQPTISIHIKNLEEELGTKLVIRTAKSFEVTTKGQEFYDCVQNVIKLKENLVNSWNGNERKVVCMGVSSLPSGYILPEVLPAYRKRNKDVYFNITQSDSSNIIREVEQGKFDIGLVGMKDDSELLEYREFYQDHMVLITPVIERALKIREMKEFPWSQILKYPLIMREQGSACGLSTEKFLQKIGYRQDDLCVVARMNDLEAIKKLVAGGLGISFVSKKAIEDYEIDKKILEFDLPEDVSKYSLYIVCKKDYILKSYVQDFIEFLSEYYK